MSTQNRVQLEGVCPFDPEWREIVKGRAVARFTIGTKERYKNASGADVEDTTYHTVVAWGSVADDVRDQIKKGTKLAIEGRLVHRIYKGKTGTKRYVTEIVLSSFQLT